MGSPPQSCLRLGAVHCSAVQRLAAVVWRSAGRVPAPAARPAAGHSARGAAAAGAARSCFAARHASAARVALPQAAEPPRHAAGRRKGPTPAAGGGRQAGGGGGGAPRMARCTEALSWLWPDTLSLPKVLNSCEVMAAAGRCCLLLGGHGLGLGLDADVNWIAGRFRGDAEWHAGACSALENRVATRRQQVRVGSLHSGCALVQCSPVRLNIHQASAGAPSPRLPSPALPLARAAALPHPSATFQQLAVVGLRVRSAAAPCRNGPGGSSGPQRHQVRGPPACLPACAGRRVAAGQPGGRALKAQAARRRRQPARRLLTRRLLGDLCRSLAHTCPSPPSHRQRIGGQPCSSSRFRAYWCSSAPTLGRRAARASFWRA